MSQIQNSSKHVIVLILSYNGKSLLEDSISSYLANQYPNFEVVVIDNGSTDGTKEWVADNYPQVTLLRTEVNLKYSGGFNFGLKYAFDEKNCDYVLITNNDVKVQDSVIEELVKIAETDDKIAFVTGKVYYYDLPDTLQTVGKKYDEFWWNGGHIGRNEKDIGLYESVEELAWCDDIYWLVSKKVYKEVGGYDTEFAFQAEDYDLQARAKMAGYKLYYTPKAKIWHKESMTIGKRSPFKAYYDARNPLIVQMKYRPKDIYLKVIKRQRYLYIKHTVKQLLKFRFKYSYMVWKGFCSAILWGKRNGKL